MPVVWTTGISALDELNDLAITSGATNDILQRNSSGIYVNRQPVGTETSQTLNSGAANDTVIGANSWKFAFFTMPTTAPLFAVTGIEWKNGTVVNGNCNHGIIQVDANPPTEANHSVICWGIAAQTGASGVQRNSKIPTTILKSGGIYGAWISTGSASGRYATATVSSANNTKALATSPLLNDITAWSATTEEPYIKVYYKPVLGV